MLGCLEVGFFDVPAGEFVEVELEPGQQRDAESEVDLPGRGSEEGDHVGDEGDQDRDEQSWRECGYLISAPPAVTHCNTATGRQKFGDGRPKISYGAPVNANHHRLRQRRNIPAAWSPVNAVEAVRSGRGLQTHEGANLQVPTANAADEFGAPATPSGAGLEGILSMYVDSSQAFLEQLEIPSNIKQLSTIVVGVVI